MSILQTIVHRRESTPISTDPFFSSVNLLLGFNGLDGATSTSDESLDSRTVTFGNQAQLDTGVSKFGTASALFDGSGDFVSVPDADEFDANAGDLTGECWVRATSIKDAVIFSKRVSGSPQSGYMFRMLATGVLEFLGWPNNNTPSITLTSSSILNINTWYHVAITREGTTWRMFIDGNLESFGTETASPGGNANVFYIAYDITNAARTWNGNIDEFRWTKGVARYTSSFSPPTEAFPRS